MSIVLLTIPGEAKREFAHALQAQTGALALVVVQKPRLKGFVARFVQFWRRARLSIFSELWYAALLRMSPGVRAALGYFNGQQGASAAPEGYMAPVLEARSVNSDEVYAELKKISPELLVVWGCTILEPRILATAKAAINLHFGYCPYYRGALANQYAVLEDDLQHVGATIHYINGHADGGDILTVIAADTTLPPREMFSRLHTQAAAAYLQTALALHSGKQLPATPQDISKSKNFFLKRWVPSVRYKLGTKVLEWERKTNQ